jgi:hypothetical protein
MKSKKWPLVVFSILLGVAMAGVVTGVSLHYCGGPEHYLGGDPGFMVRPGTHGDVTQSPTPYPYWYEYREGMDRDVFEEAAQWWRDRVDYEITTSYTHGSDAYWDAHHESKGLSHPGLFLFSVETVPDNEHCGGVTSIVYDRDTGEIVSGLIKINPMYTRDRRFYVAALIHEMGHTFALEDDPLPGLDLNSIMRLKLNPGGVLTPSDSKLLKAAFLKRRIVPVVDNVEPIDGSLLWGHTR